MFNEFINGFLNKFIKSDYVKAQILAAIRHFITGGGAALIAHGYANSEMVQDALGLVLVTFSFIWSQFDVKWVDGKIQIALHSDKEETPK